MAFRVVVIGFDRDLGIVHFVNNPAVDVFLLRFFVLFGLVISTRGKLSGITWCRIREIIRHYLVLSIGTPIVWSGARFPYCPGKLSHLAEPLQQLGF